MWDHYKTPLSPSDSTSFIPLHNLSYSQMSTTKDHHSRQSASITKHHQPSDTKHNPLQSHPSKAIIKDMDASEVQSNNSSITDASEIRSDDTSNMNASETQQDHTIPANTAHNDPELEAAKSQSDNTIPATTAYTDLELVAAEALLLLSQQAVVFGSSAAVPAASSPAATTSASATISPQLMTKHQPELAIHRRIGAIQASDKIGIELHPEVLYAAVEAGDEAALDMIQGAKALMNMRYNPRKKCKRRRPIFCISHKSTRSPVKAINSVTKSCVQKRVPCKPKCTLPKKIHTVKEGRVQTRSGRIPRPTMKARENALGAPTASSSVPKPKASPELKVFPQPQSPRGPSFSPISSASVEPTAPRKSLIVILKANPNTEPTAPSEPSAKQSSASKSKSPSPSKPNGVTKSKSPRKAGSGLKLTIPNWQAHLQALESDDANEAGSAATTVYAPPAWTEEDHKKNRERQIKDSRAPLSPAEWKKMWRHTYNETGYPTPPQSLTVEEWKTERIKRYGRY